MERKDLLEANGKIFAPQGQALDEVASRNVKVLVVGNPANTNCLIAMKNAPEPEARAVHRDDAPGPQPRHLARSRRKSASRSPRCRKMTIWGNHSATQYPDVFQAEVRRQESLADDQRPGLAGSHLHPDGAEARRGDHRGARPLLGGERGQRRHRPRARLGRSARATGDWVTMGIPSDGSYGIPEGVLYGYPVTCKGGKYEIVKGIEISEFSRKRMDATLKELHEERDGVKHLLG